MVEMSLLTHYDPDMVLSVRLMQIMLRSGASMEETMRYIADERLGKVSDVFRTVLDRSMNGSSVCEELRDLRDGKPEGPMRKMLSMILMCLEDECSIEDSFEDFADMLEKEEKITRHESAKRVGIASEMLSYSTLAGIIVIIFDSMSGMKLFEMIPISFISPEVVDIFFLLLVIFSAAVSAYIFMEARD